MSNLMKKTKAELVDIILRKDETEKKLSSDIEYLRTELTETSTKLNSANIRIRCFEKDMEGMENVLATKQEQIDALISEKNNLTEKVEEWSKKYVNLRNISSLRRNVIFTCFAIIMFLLGCIIVMAL